MLLIIKFIIYVAMTFLTVGIPGVIASSFIMYSQMQDGTKISAIMLIGYFTYPIVHFVSDKMLRNKNRDKK